MNERTLITKLNKLFPPSSSEPWDYPGYQCGVRNPKREIKKVLLCLDFTEDVLPELDKFQPDIILSHHPFFFGKRKDVLLEDPRKILLQEEIKKRGISLFSYHTSFDKGQNGMNDTLLSLLGYPVIKVAADHLMRLAKANETDMLSLMKHIKETFHLPFLLYLGDIHKRIDQIALVAGGDSVDYFKSSALGADCYISGDCPHHTRLEMKRYGLNYIELPHEVEEVGFLVGMKKALLTLDDKLDIDAFAFENYFSIC